ncbi:MAG: glucosaminidase domain-containing protein [Gammaproteobacteria bacterium]|nr:glucosaminidase domain-containing protein [Gammaproteobacteria bacterium]
MMIKKQYFLVALCVLLIGVIIGGVFYSPSIPFKPNFASIEPLAIRQQIFINFMVPKVQNANDAVLATRERVMGIISEWQNRGSVSGADRYWLYTTAYVYQIPHFKITHPKDVEDLLSRIDEVPASLVLAQSGDESAWGASRFATQADNFFGQHCFVAGCGVVPLKRAPGQTYEVQKFRNVQASVTDYIYNLNTNSSYQGFRDLRAKMRSENKPLAGFSLVSKLGNYSILGEGYIIMISNIIISHNLMQYDELDSDV